MGRNLNRVKALNFNTSSSFGLMLHTKCIYGGKNDTQEWNSEQNSLTEQASRQQYTFD